MFFLTVTNKFIITCETHLVGKNQGFPLNYGVFNQNQSQTGLLIVSRFTCICFLEMTEHTWSRYFVSSISYSCQFKSIQKTETSPPTRSLAYPTPVSSIQLASIIRNSRQWENSVIFSFVTKTLVG